MFSGILLPLTTHATDLQTDVNSKLDFVAGESGAQTSGNVDLRLAVMVVVRYILGVVGIVFLIMIIYGGFTYLFSAGNEVAAARAIHIIQNAVIGLLIIFVAFSLSTFIINSLQRATTDGNSTTYGFGCGAGVNGAGDDYADCGGYVY